MIFWARLSFYWHDPVKNKYQSINQCVSMWNCDSTFHYIVNVISILFQYKRNFLPKIFLPNFPLQWSAKKINQSIFIYFIFLVFGQILLLELKHNTFINLILYLIFVF